MAQKSLTHTPAKGDTKSVPSAKNRAENPLVEMQAELMSKGNQLSQNWTELFCLLTKYQAELVIKQDQLSCKEITIQNDKKGADMGNSGAAVSDSSATLSAIQQDLKVKSDLLALSQTKLIMKEKALLTSDTRVAELQQEIHSLKFTLKQKKEELQIKDGLLKKVERQMLREVNELQVESNHLKESLSMEKEAHRDTFDQLQEALKTVRNLQGKTSNGQSDIGYAIDEQKIQIDNTYSLAQPVNVLNGTCTLNIPNLIFSETYRNTVKSTPVTNGQLVYTVENGATMETAADVMDDIEGSGELQSDHIAQTAGPSAEKSTKKWKRTRKRKNPQKVTNVLDAMTTESANDIINVPLPKKSSKSIAKSPIVTLTVPKIKPPKTVKLKVSKNMFKKPESQKNGTDCSMFHEVADNLVKESDLDVESLNLEIQPVLGGRKTKRPFQLFGCLVCAQEFVSLNALSNHAVEHTGEVVQSDLFQCEMCGKKFSDKSNYRRHRRIHSGEKPYKCHLCDIAYSRSDILKQHLVTRHSVPATESASSTQEGPIFSSPTT